MIQVSVKSVGDPCAPHLAEFRQFLGAAEAGNDALIKSVLKSAMVAVQEWEDRSLLPETITLIHARRPDPWAPVRLYRTVDEVTSVKDEDGNDMEYTRTGNLLQVKRPCRNVEVVYKTKPEAGDVEALLLKVYRVAAARYDGDDARTINQILMEG